MMKGMLKGEKTTEGEDIEIFQAKKGEGEGERAPRGWGTRQGIAPSQHKGGRTC